MGLRRPRLRVALISALLACAAGCVAQPSAQHAAWLAELDRERALAAANEAQDAGELKAFEAAASRTADGSRAYEYIWDTGEGPETVGHKIILLVRPDGSGTLYGAVKSPVELTAEAIRPFEGAVAATGFPKLESVGQGGDCLAGNWPPRPVFTASIGGRDATSFGDPCGEVAVSIVNAVRDLLALVDANGGPERRFHAIQDVPVPVTAFTAKHAPPIAPEHGFRLLRMMPGAAGQQDHRLPQRPAARPGPRRLVERHGLAEGGAARALEQGPGDDQIAGRVADGRETEVDHRAQTPARHEQVAGGDIAVQPDGRTAPRGRQGRLPDRSRRPAVPPNAAIAERVSPS